MQEPDLRDPEQRDLIRNIILKKRKQQRRRRRESTQSQPQKEEPKEKMVITSISGELSSGCSQHKSTAESWESRPAVRKGSLSKLAVHPSRMPPALSPVDVGGRWMRPQSLVDEERELSKRYNARNDDTDRVKKEKDEEQEQVRN